MGTKIKEFRQYNNLFTELVRKGIKLKYRRSYLGIVWSMIEPLLTMIVLTLVFGTLLGHKEKSFPVYILTGRLMYTLFSQSTTSALKSIRQNEAMIKKVYVPKYLYPLANICFNYILFLISLVVLAVVALVLGVFPTWRTFACHRTVAQSVLTVHWRGYDTCDDRRVFRDMEYLWNVALMLIMYTCAIFYYPKKILNSNVSWILKFNPLFCIINNFRNCVFGRAMSAHMLIYSFTFAFICIVIGIAVFIKSRISLSCICKAWEEIS